MIDLRLDKLSIQNFRNLEQDIFHFSQGLNCIFGKNGNGKTNLLEAIHLIIERKSFRKNTRFPQFLSIDCEKPEILFSSLFTDNDSPITYSGKILEKSSEYYLDGKSSKRKIATRSLFIGPFDSHSFHTSATFRRNWVDSSLSALDGQYKKSLKSYTQAIRQRNILLKRPIKEVLEQIIAIDKALCVYAENIVKKRAEFLTQLGPKIGEAFHDLFSKEHNFEVILQSDFKALSSDEIFLEMRKNIEKDHILGHTHKGLHRDDYVLLFDGLSSYEFCSLGQQKMGYLGLIFAYTELFRYKFNSYPILLIDDVSGELDSTRWKNLIDYIRQRKFQVFITTANDNFRSELEKLESARKFYIEDGSLLPQ